VLLTRGGLTIVEWPPAPGAAGYLIGGQLQRDTFLVLGQENVQISSELLISAVDTNWFTYMSDTLVRASGIDGGFGLFGAMSTARVVFSGAAKRP
jgi:hypothetical protein